MGIFYKWKFGVPNTFLEVKSDEYLVTLTVIKVGAFGGSFDKLDTFRCRNPAVGSGVPKHINDPLIFVAIFSPAITHHA